MTFFGKKSAQDNAYQAQLLIDQAVDEDEPERQIAMAQAALALSPTCSDAYLILAEYAASPEEEITLYEAAVNAAASEVGEKQLKKYEGHFWEVLETRPYMRARLELAECLRDAGRIDDAIDHFHTMIKLNPNDNLGCRQRLASALLKMERHEELHQLLAQYPDDFLVDLHYARALLAFREQGDTEESRQYLQEAAEKNIHVPTYLTGAHRLPRNMPEYISPGEESEAVSYTAEFLSSWRATPGAIPWLRETLKVKSPAPEPRPFPPWSKVKRVIEQLPQSEAIWEVDLVSFPTSSHSKDRSWGFLVVDAATSRPLEIEIQDDRPSDAKLWQALIKVMRRPENDEPTRPQAIKITRKTWHKNWGKKLDQVGIACSLADELLQIPVLIDEIHAPVTRSQQFGESGVSVDEDELGDIPQKVGDVWIAVMSKLSTWIQIDGEMRRPAVLIVIDEIRDSILATNILDEEPPEDWLWNGISQAICCPADNEPRRPGVIQVVSDRDCPGIKTRLDSIGIEFVAMESTEAIDEKLEHLSEYIAGSPIKSLTKSPGITSEQLAGFYKSAAEFYRNSPWQKIAGDTIIRIETDAVSTNVWYAVVMGQMGQELGLALYDDYGALRDILTGQLTDDENARRTSALSVMFGEKFDISAVDYDAIHESGWPVASEEAYPTVIRVNPGLAVRLPLAWEIELLECCLQLLPQFIESKDHSSTLTTRTATRESVMSFSLVE